MTSGKLSELSSADLEMLIFATGAIWGDGSVDSEELDLLYKYCEKRIDNLDLADLSDPADKDLSVKEYIIALFQKIDDISENTELLDKFVLNEKFAKLKGKKYEATDQIKFFNLFIEELLQSYEKSSVEKPDEKFRGVSEELDELFAKGGEITDQEKDMQRLISQYKEAWGSFMTIFMTLVIVGTIGGFLYGAWKLAVWIWNIIVGFAIE